MNSIDCVKFYSKKLGKGRKESNPTIQIFNKEQKILVEMTISIKDYYLFRFYDDIFQYIDMERSKFILKWRDVIQEFCFTSKEFYLSKDKKTFEDFETELIIKEVYLLNSFPKYDIFHFEGRNIISEKLLNAFIENDITGYEVSAYDVLKTE